MKKFKRKGFTIVELVIVIAVIAILSAVLIPTISNLVKKANLAADEQAIVNMNKLAAMGNAEDAYDYASDVVETLYSYGFNEGKLVTYSSGYHYAYDFEKNQFYLLDDKDNAIYPHDQVDESKLWGFYMNSKSDKIESVNKYIALETIDDAMAFDKEHDSVFCGTSPYTIDLNGFYINLPGKDTITVLNGAVEEGTKFNLGANVVKRVNISGNNEYQTVTNLMSELDKVAKIDQATQTYTIENVVFKYSTDSINGEKVNGIDFRTTLNAYKNVVFKNCTFVGYVTVGGENSTVENYTFDGCSFNSAVNGRALGLEAGSVKANYTVKNCNFNSVRGIIISSGVFYSDTSYGTILIDNNTFIVNNDRIAIQVASYSKDNRAIIYKVSIDDLTISNNKFKAGFAAVRAHMTLENTELSAINISFANNTLSEGMKSVVDDDDTSKSKEFAEAWASKFN